MIFEISWKNHKSYEKRLGKYEKDLKFVQALRNRKRDSRRSRNLAQEDLSTMETDGK